MTSHSRRMFSLAAALLVSAGVAQAQGHSQDKDHGHDKDKDRQEHHDEARAQTPAGGWKGDRAQADRRDEDRRDNDRRDGWNNGAKVPPGLAKKPGGMPPGQYKKRYGTQDGVSALSDVFGRHGYTVVRTTNAGSSRYVYYRLRNGSVQRAIVSPGADRLGFSNVPRSLLQEVLTRLY